LQFVPDHRYAIHVWKIVPINHAVVICSDIFSHVYGLCRFHMFINGSCWTVWNGFAFFVGVSTQSPLPSSCLECGGLQCSHIFIIRCVFICFHSWFSSFPGAFLFSFFHLFSFIFIFSFLFSFLFIYFHLFSFVLIYFHFFSFFHFLLFFSLEKTTTNLNHLHVDPRLCSADKKSLKKSPDLFWTLWMVMHWFRMTASPIHLFSFTRSMVLARVAKHNPFALILSTPQIINTSGSFFIRGVFIIRVRSFPLILN
jgi:hypothetical protein